MLKSIRTITFILALLTSVFASGQDSLTVIVQNIHITDQSQITLPVSVVHFDSISYFQYSIHWDTALFQFNAVNNFNLDGLDVGAFNTTEGATNAGKFGFTWIEPSAQSATLSDSTRIYDIVLDVISTSEEISEIKFATDPTDIEAGDVNNIEVALKTINGTISFESNTTSITAPNRKAKMKVFQNSPNPFRESTTIAFELAKAEEVAFNVYDLGGRIVINKKSFFPQGLNYIELSKLQLNGPGVYEYSLVQKTKTITKRLVLID